MKMPKILSQTLKRFTRNFNNCLPAFLRTRQKPSDRPTEIDPLISSDSNISYSPQSDQSFDKPAENFLDKPASPPSNSDLNLKQALDELLKINTQSSIDPSQPQKTRPPEYGAGVFSNMTPPTDEAGVFSTIKPMEDEAPRQLRRVGAIRNRGEFYQRRPNGINRQLSSTQPRPRFIAPPEQPPSNHNRLIPPQLIMNNYQETYTRNIDPFRDTEVSESIRSLTTEINAPLIAGAVTRVSGDLENVSVMYGESGEVVSLYSKQYLTPFGEYIPLRSIARLVSPFVDDVSDFSAGERIDNHVIRGVTVAPVICFELLSDSLVRKATQNSDALVVQTNSATFAGTAESAQQLNITRIRAMENAREIVSVSTIGISAHIDINGRVTQQTDEDVSAVLQGELQGVSNQSVASRLGAMATPLALLLSFFPLVLHRIRRP